MLEIVSWLLILHKTASGFQNMRVHLRLFIETKEDYILKDKAGRILDRKFAPSHLKKVLQYSKVNIAEISGGWRGEPGREISCNVAVNPRRTRNVGKPKRYNN